MIRVDSFVAAEEALEAVEEFLAAIVRRNRLDAIETAIEAAERFTNLSIQLQGRPA